jgi:hypothetical protein
MLQVGESSDPGCLDFKGRGASRDGRELRLEGVDFLDGNGGPEEFQRQVKIRRRSPFDGIGMSAQAGNKVLDRALQIGIDANRDEGANFFRKLGQGRLVRLFVEFPLHQW